MLSIEGQPRDVADRTIPGHWEGDFILGKQKHTVLGTLLERTTRYTILVPLKAKDATSVRNAYAKALRSLPREITKTLTYDQGKEMRGHKQFTLNTSIAVYFAHPGSPWERGTNENPSGLLRQYLLKGTDLSGHIQRELNTIAHRLNTRPRKCLNIATPLEVYTQLRHYSPIALGS
jgi:IS30 family transposase